MNTSFHKLISIDILIPLLGYFILSTFMLSIGVLTKGIGMEFQLTPSSMGALVSGFLTGRTLTSLLAGNISDRIGVEKMIIVTVLFCSIIIIISGFVWAIEFLVITLILIGLGLGAFNPTLYTLLGKRESVSRGLLMGYAVSFFSLGGFIGPSIAGVITARYGWRMSFLIIGIISLFIGIIIAQQMFPRFVKNSNKIAKVKRVETYWNALNKNTIIVAISTFLFNFAWWTIISWTPSFLISSRGLELAESGLITGLFFIPRMIGSPILGAISDKVGRVIILSFAGFASFAISFAYYTWDLSLESLLIMSLIYGFATSGMWALQMALTQDLVDSKYIGTATGFVQNTAMIGGTLAPLTTGVTVSMVGIAQAMIYCASLPLLASGFLILFCKEKRKF
ncbi:MAG: MFS transporter [Nitrososphaerales archaeon]